MNGIADPVLTELGTQRTRVNGASLLRVMWSAEAPERIDSVFLSDLHDYDRASGRDLINHGSVF